jgi:hypothetical protein
VKKPKIIDFFTNNKSDILQIMNIAIISIITIPVFIAVLVIWAVKADRQKKQKFIDEMEKLFGIRKTNQSNWTNPDLKGFFNGRNLHLFCYTEGSGKNQHTRTAITYELDVPTDFSFSLKTDLTADVKNIPLIGGLLAKAIDTAKALTKMVDIEIGDAKFDQDWIISTTMPERLIQILDQTTKQRINDLSRPDPKLSTRTGISIELINGLLTIKSQGANFDIAHYSKIIHELDPLASVIEDECNATSYSTSEYDDSCYSDNSTDSSSYSQSDSYDYKNPEY